MAMGSRAPLSGPLEVVVTAYLPIPKSWSKSMQALARTGQIRPTTKSDADNYGKTVDSCNKIVWLDDAQIVSMHIHKYYNEEPRLVIEVWSL